MVTRATKLVLALMWLEAVAIPRSAAASTFEKQKDGVIVRLEAGAVKLQVCSERIIRVLYDPTGAFTPVQSLVIVSKWQPCKFAVQNAKDHIELRTAKLNVRIAKRTGAISFYDTNHELFFREDPEMPRSVTPSRVLDEDTHHAQLNLKFSADEGVYGLGQYQDGMMNYRGHEVILTQENTIVAIPFLISTRNYGILLDNYSKIIFHDKNDGAYFWCEVGDVIDYYFIAGSNMDEVIRGYREATGRSPMFGKWAYGYWQSKERYKTQDEVLSIAKEYRSRRIPIDNIVQDWQYWGDDVGYWSSMKFDSTRYPDPAAMIRTLHEKYRMHLMISIWPVPGYKTEMFREMQSKNLLYEPFHWTDGHTYDAYSEEARRIYWRYINEGLLSKGVDAYWMDATEPEVFVAPHERSIKEARRNAMGTMARYLNPYSLMTTGGVYAGQRSVTSGKRVFIMTRSAFAGQQRNAAATWSGDIIADWITLQHQISGGLNFCMAGLPYWSCDIGGFHVMRYSAFQGCDDPSYAELYVRWFQFGAFNPIFRSHGTDCPREVWQFGEPGSWAYEALVKYDNLRYRLLPYLYSLAWKVTSDGYTIMRGLPMDFTADKNVYRIDDQFMFGPALMINPVTEHMYHGEDYKHEVIPSDRLNTADGKQGGLTVQYFNGINLDTLVVDSVLTSPEFDLYLGKDLPKVVNWEKNSMRWSGELRSQSAGEYEFWLSTDDAVRFWLDEKLMLDAWNDRGESKTHRIKVSLDAEKKYKFRIEHARRADATKLRLAWRTPEMAARKYDSNNPGTRKVYLPQNTVWYDFWTGERISGGRHIERATPIDVMPIYVRAGSIVPMGPLLQYADELPADPIELRVYLGADAGFDLYEDENDNYNYEKGVYAIIPIRWDDKTQTLTIGERKGRFPGMLEQRTFQVVWVSRDHGTGVDIADRADVVVTYDGKILKVKKKK